MGPRLLLLGLLSASTLIASIVHWYDRGEAEQRLLRSVDGANGTLQERLHTLVTLLQGVSGLFDASIYVDAGEFRRYVASVDLRADHPSVLGLGYALRLGPGDVPDVEARARAEGDRDFRVWPTPTRSDDAAIIYLEPRDRGNDRALGYVMSSEPTRRAAMVRSAHSGKLVASEIVLLVQDGGVDAPGFLVFTPHYTRGLPLDTPEERTAALEGFVYAPIRARELFAGISEQWGVELQAVEDGGEGRPVYASSKALDGAIEWRHLEIGGQRWTVVYAAAHGGTPLWRSSAAAVFLVCVAISVLLARLQVVQARSRARARSDADALRESEQRYRHLAEAMPCGVFAVSGDGRLVYRNGKLGGAELGEPFEASLARSVHPEDDVALLAWRSAVASARPWSATFRVRAEAGWRWCLGQAVAQGAGSARSWVGSITDIDAQKRAEEEVHRQAEELERRVEQRTAELQRTVRELEAFAAVASHDLQEPLRKIVMFGDRLKADLGADAPAGATESLDRIRTSASRLQRLIRDLLAFSRVSRAEMTLERVDLDAITRQLVAEMLEGRPGGAEVEVSPLPTVLGDATLLGQLLANLVGNALKFHKPGRPARVRVYTEPARAPPCDGELDRWFHLVVEDEGIGFEPRHAARIFDVFQRLHARDRYEGTGIGLAICRRVAELHGGRIFAEGRPGVGARFITCLRSADPVPS